MKLNISYPANGSQKIVEIDDERKLRPFMEKRMGTEVSSLDMKYPTTTARNDVLDGMKRMGQMADWGFFE